MQPAPLWTPQNIAEIARLIDHTLLTPTASVDDVLAAANYGLTAGVASVCVQPCHAKRVAEFLRASPVRTCTVVNFPHGSSVLDAVKRETEIALRDGAAEIDMVLPLSLAKSGEWSENSRFVREVKRVCGNSLLKVILEVCEWTEQEIRTLSGLAVESGADFIKTSTGYGRSGATHEAVRLMVETSGSRAGVKAAGGIRNLETLRAMVAAGASRIGTSSTEAILTESRSFLARH